MQSNNLKASQCWEIGAGRPANPRLSVFLRKAKLKREEEKRAEQNWPIKLN